MAVDEIVLPVTDPETEWVRGRALQKVSPTYAHSRCQTIFTVLLDTWADSLGDVGTEWRFRVPVPAGPRRPLVPDISFVTRERLDALSDAEIPAPPIAPDLAVEILSPSDDPRDVADKIATYLTAGTALVVVVDPRERTIAVHDRLGITMFGGGDVMAHAALPGFTVSVTDFFRRALDRRRAP